MDARLNWIPQGASPDEDKLRSMSKHIIRLLESRILKDFSLRVVCGAEQEFSLIPSDAYLRDVTCKVNKGANPLGVTRDRNTGHWPQGLSNHNTPNYVPKGEILPNPDAAASRLFAHSPYISHFQAENKPFVYEVAISHKSRHNSPEIIARAIEATRNAIVKNWQKTCAALGVQEITGVSFDALTDAETRIDAAKQQLGPKLWWKLPCDLTCVQLAPTQALQINISLVDAQGRKPLNLHRDSPILETAMLPVLREGTIFSTPNAASYARLHMRSQVGEITRHPKAFTTVFTREATGAALLRRNKYWQKDDSYIENRLPGADADPYMAMAITLLALYDGLKQCADKTGAIDPSSPHYGIRLGYEYMPKDKSEALDWLAKGIRIRPLLNALEPTLGDRYCSTALGFFSQHDLTPIPAQQTRAR